ncbi:GNAT family N-acetyltransferase [Haloterrigena alkaliphila]|uniref:GNAT family N-acetyltransferase n=1 Tax=Haloterrigena alkaliphila TaxID=2816475 RepID=A0A8A2VEL0_9EURY|nr:GNAT family N-acetyltransferase [Haloterrigena alkaliphila]QSW99941.1 GNAT family N-acetyltransferase [Haloterrigena alkaliphila]
MTRDVRRATTDDVWAIQQTARESWHAVYDDVLGPATVDDVVDDWYALGDLESTIGDARGRDDVAFLVAEPTAGGDGRDRTDGGRDPTAAVPVGFAHAVPWPENTSVAYLAGLYVRPGRWGEGTGTALLESLEASLDGPFGRVRSAVLAANDVGVSFAESAGFERIGTRETGLAEGLEERVYEKGL